MSQPEKRLLVGLYAPAYNGGLMPGWATRLKDAETGEDIMTCSRLVIDIDASDVIKATATLFADENDEPVYNGLPVLNGLGQPRTVKVDFYVCGVVVVDGKDRLDGKDKL